MSATGREWVVEPPGPGRISLGVAVGEGVELTPEQEVALGALVEALAVTDAEVGGFAGGCSALKPCTLECPKNYCGALSCSQLHAPIAASGAGSWNLGGTFGSIQ